VSTIATAKPVTKADALKELASRQLSKRRLLPFAQRLNPKYLPGWVHEDICRRLERFSDDVAKGLSPRLMLLMPPRHGKSELASKMFPAWHLGRHPDHEVIACSYNISLAMGFSKKIKAIMDDPAYQTVFDTRLDPNNRSTEEWTIQGNTGGYVAAGVGGGITGKGAHVLCIDDPIKNAEEADSATTRDSIWDWYGSTAYTRLAPGAGVLIIQCMTGDTPVLMASGTERRLDTLIAGDEIATYSRGALATSTVQALKSNGRDSVFKITTSSGRMVRANGRHPFLATIDGELKWVRTRSLTTAHKIVGLEESGGSGKASPAKQKDAHYLSAAGDSAPRTTTRENGRPGTAPQASTPRHAAKLTSSTATASLPPITTNYSPRSEGYVPSARSHLAASSPNTGKTNSPSTTATTPARCEGCCAMTATQESDILELSPWHLPQPGTSDFTLDDIVSIEPDGVEEVFDMQVERTENFIANGLVSHNTWWHDDDLAGRIQQSMAAGAGDEDVDHFEIIKYPAIAEAAEFLNLETDEIVRVETEAKNPAEALLDAVKMGIDAVKLRFLRAKGDCLHEDRYDLRKLRKIRATIAPRHWSALFQQNPVPDDGAFFSRDMFRRAPLPFLKNYVLQVTWDFAIGIKKANDFTVGTASMLDDDDILHFADQVRMKTNDIDLIANSMLDLCQKWWHPSLILGVEDGQIWKTMESTFMKACRKRNFYPRIQVLPPLTDKEVRASPLKGRMQAGMVSFADKGDWYEDCRNEMLRFPAGVHDDRVDSCAWGAQVALTRVAPQKTRKKAEKSWKDRLRAGASGSTHMAS
jgi:predicted phage terminase large subunit-like protein